jgi:hypothetical protein
MIAPPQEHMARLLKLAMTGNMRAIRSEAEQIRALDERYRPFADELRRLASGYQSPAILRLIEQHAHKREAA